MRSSLRYTLAIFLLFGSSLVTFAAMVEPTDANICALLDKNNKIVFFTQELEAGPCEDSCDEEMAKGYYKEAVSCAFEGFELKTY